MAVRLEDMGNLLGAMAALEQAAKEMGGAYAGRGGAVGLKISLNADVRDTAEHCEVELSTARTAWII